MNWQIYDPWAVENLQSKMILYYILAGKVPCTVQTLLKAMPCILPANISHLACF